jgi:hypothetical protein
MRKGFLALLGVVIAVVVVSATASANTAFPHAAFTTTNPTSSDGPGHCQNGNELVNCNIYDGKEFVWLNGGPATAGLDDGDYFFAVLVPGGQGGGDNPNDATENNLSDEANGDYTTRTFTVTGGVVSYSGTHDFDATNNKIRLMPYDDTTNPGGVYILAICSLADAGQSDGVPGIDPSDCKYDAFKINAGDVVPPADDLTVSKGAAGAYTNTYQWLIGKSVDKTLVTQVGGSATFNYTVSVTHDGGTISGVTVSGTISVLNPNLDGNGDPIPVDIDSVTDELSDGTPCTVTGGGAQSLTLPQTDFAYSCTLSGLPSGQLDNTATVAWSSQALANDAFLAAGSGEFTFTDIAFSASTVDECVNVTDTSAGSLGTACVGDANPKTFNYSRTIPVPQFDCLSYDNTATFTTTDTGATGSASKTVTVCGPARTGGLTMGFWQNKNGQAIIKGGSSTAAVCNSGTWLRQYAPFQDLSATASCTAVATYVANVIKAANASGASMNVMLKAQMLATALDVYFSNPALGGNQINAPAPIGGVTINLTNICKNIPTCSILENVSSAFGGATSLTVSQMLTYAAGQSNPGGSVWYGQVKATQEKAKDAFDAINNQVAFGP